MTPYAYFVTSNWGYVPYLTALLNSLQKRGNTQRVYVMHQGFKQEYLDAIQRAYSFEVVLLSVDRKDHDVTDEVGENLFMKQSRFKYIAQYGGDHAAICMLDADMFVVSERFGNFFEMVDGTNLLVGCEESYKWNFDKKYTCRGAVVFPEPVKAWKFMCSVPIFFDLNKWRSVFDTYNDMAFNSWEMENGEKKKRVGDIYTWSISIYRNNRQNDCVLMPMQSMTQVHGTAGAFWCAIRNDSGYWHSVDGSEVYSIHGRIGTQNWEPSQWGWYSSGLEKSGIPITDKISSSAKIAYNAIRQEWFDLTIGKNAIVNLSEFLPVKEEWLACNVEGK